MIEAAEPSDVLPAFVLFVVFSASLGSVVYAYTRKGRMNAEVSAVLGLIDEDTNLTVGGESPDSVRGVPRHVFSLVEEAVQPDHHQIAVVAVSELTGRAHLFRSQALLLARGLPRIGLLSGGGGAFVIVALGAFDQASLTLAGASVAFGMVSAFSSHGLSSQAFRIAKRYGDICDVLARQVRRHFG